MLRKITNDEHQSLLAEEMQQVPGGNLFAKLPKDVLGLIVTYCSITTIKKIAQTDKRTRDIIYKLPCEMEVQIAENIDVEGTTIRNHQAAYIRGTYAELNALLSEREKVSRQVTTLNKKCCINVPWSTNECMGAAVFVLPLALVACPVNFGIGCAIIQGYRICNRQDRAQRQQFIDELEQPKTATIPGEKLFSLEEHAQLPERIRMNY
jgi:hypothetical protein